jgi:hypothetical protein
MPKESIHEIKAYLREVEAEQQLIEQREKQFELGADQTPAREEPPEPIIPEPSLEVEAQQLERLAALEPDASDALEESLGLLPAEPEPQEAPSKPAEPAFDIASDLLEKTELVLRKYSPAFVEQNLETTSLMLTFLQKTALMLPFDTEFAVRGKIEHNIEVLASLFEQTKLTVIKHDERQQLEGFMSELDKALRRYSKQQIAKDPERAQYDYNVLLEARKGLPEGNPTFEMVVAKRMEEFERRINSILDEGKAQKELDVFTARIKSFLKNAESQDLEKLDSEYKLLVDQFKSIEHRLDKSTHSSAKNNLYRCKEKLDAIKSHTKEEIRNRYHVDEEKRKEEYLGMRTFWKSYLRDLRVYTQTVDAAPPSQYFSLYTKYQSMLETFYNLVRKDMITKEEVQQATQILEYVEGRLERLRGSI